VKRNLKKFSLPKFNGDKTKYEFFRAPFESILDETDEPAKYMMIRLKNYLERKAEEGILKLGFSEEAYKNAKNTSNHRFGVERRQRQSYLENVKKIKPLQEFVLVSIIVTLREHNRSSELEHGSLLSSSLCCGENSEDHVVKIFSLGTREPPSRVTGNTSRLDCRRIGVSS